MTTADLQEIITSVSWKLRPDKPDMDQQAEALERQLQDEDEHLLRKAKDGGPLLLAGKCWCYGLQSRHPACAERAKGAA